MLAISEEYQKMLQEFENVEEDYEEDPELMDQMEDDEWEADPDDEDWVLPEDDGWEADPDDEDWNLPEMLAAGERQAETDDEDWDLSELDEEDEPEADVEEDDLALPEMEDERVWEEEDEERTPDMPETNAGKNGVWKPVDLSDDEEWDELMAALKEGLEKPAEPAKSIQPAELAESYDRMWRNYFEKYFPPEVELIGPENDPEFPSADFPGDFQEVLQMELAWKSGDRAPAKEESKSWSHIRSRQGAYCSACGAWSRRRVNYYMRKFLDLRVRGYGKTELSVRVPQFRCSNPECGKIFSAPMPMLLREGKRMTARLQEFIWLLSDCVNAEKTAGILTAMGMVLEHGGQAVDGQEAGGQAVDGQTIGGQAVDEQAARKQAVSGQAVSGDRVLEIRKIYRNDEELNEYAVGCGYGRYKEKKSVETIAQEILDGLTREGEDLMTVWREETDSTGKTERIVCDRAIRLEAMARILDEVFDN